MASSAKSWGQKRTSLTQELIRRLLNCNKWNTLCRKKKAFKHLHATCEELGIQPKVQIRNPQIRPERLQQDSKAERDGVRPTYRPKGWNENAPWLAKRRKENNWLGPFWKSCIFVPPSGIRAQTDAKQGGGDANWCQRNLSYQDYRNCRQDFGANIIGEHRPIWWRWDVCSQSKLKEQNQLQKKRHMS